MDSGLRCAREYPYQLLIDETNDIPPIPDYVQNNGWWMRQTKNYPCQMMYEAAVDGCDQWRTTHSRWRTKQLLMDKRDEDIHTRWWAKQLLMCETNEGLPIPDDVQINCWWPETSKESMPDDSQKNCWWMRPMKGYQYQQMMYKITVDEWDQWRATNISKWCTK